MKQQIKATNPVQLIITNNKKQILLVKRSKEEVESDKWSIPGGCPEGKETLENTLKREIKEELNCQVLEANYFKSYFYVFSRRLFVRPIYFYGKIKGKIKLCSELSEYKWFNQNELKKLKFAFNQKQVIRNFLSFFDHKLK